MTGFHNNEFNVHPKDIVMTGDATIEKEKCFQVLPSLIYQLYPQGPQLNNSLHDLQLLDTLYAVITK